MWETSLLECQDREREKGGTGWTMWKKGRKTEAEESREIQGVMKTGRNMSGWRGAVVGGGGWGKRLIIFIGLTKHMNIIIIIIKKLKTRMWKCGKYLGGYKLEPRFCAFIVAQADTARLCMCLHSCVCVFEKVSGCGQLYASALHTWVPLGFLKAAAQYVPDSFTSEVKPFFT